MTDTDDDVWESLDDALAALALSRGWHYDHRDDPDYFKWMMVGPRVKVHRASRKAYGERLLARAEAARRARLNPQPIRTGRRGRPRKAQSVAV